MLPTAFTAASSQSPRRHHTLLFFVSNIFIIVIFIIAIFIVTIKQSKNLFMLSISGDIKEIESILESKLSVPPGCVDREVFYDLRIDQHCCYIDVPAIEHDGMGSAVNRNNLVGWKLMLGTYGLDIPDLRMRVAIAAPSRSTTRQGQRRTILIPTSDIDNESAHAGIIPPLKESKCPSLQANTWTGT